MQADAIENKVAPFIRERNQLAYDEYLSFCAIGGMKTEDDGAIVPMKLPEFCQHYGINPATTWRWKKTPGFADKVRERRNELFKLTRETKLFNTLYVIANTSLGDRGHGNVSAAVSAAKILLGHDGNLQLPIQRAEVTIQTGIVDILNAATRDGIIEGETSGTTIDNGASAEDTGALPAAS